MPWDDSDYSADEACQQVVAHESKQHAGAVGSFLAKAGGLMAEAPFVSREERGRDATGFPYYINWGSFGPRPAPVAPEAPPQSDFAEKLIARHPERVKALDDREAWLRARSGLITASSAHSYLTLWAEAAKRFNELAGLADREVVSAFTQRFFDYGHKHEEGAAVAFTRATGIRVWPEADVGLLVHPKVKCVGATPDRLLMDIPGVIVEIKCPAQAGIRPVCLPQYYVQVQIQMSVCEAVGCFFVQFVPEDQRADGYLKNARGVDVMYIPRAEHAVDALHRSLSLVWRWAATKRKEEEANVEARKRKQLRMSVTPPKSAKDLPFAGAQEVLAVRTMHFFKNGFCPPKLE